MKATVAEVRPAHDVQAIVQQTHRAIFEGNRNSWLIADNYLRLSDAGWAQQKIAEEFKSSQSSVSRFIRCAEKYAALHKRPGFYDAFQDVAPETSHARTLGTGQDEWYTPPEFPPLIEKVFGGAIDLDPASCTEAQKIIRAGAFFTEADDGLSREWFGRVFMNPPYSQPKISNFIMKLIAEFDSAHVKEAIALTTNNTDTDWFQALARNCAAMCFTDGRVSFIAPDGRKPAPNQGHVFTYFGDNPSSFQEGFATVGVTFRKY